MSKIYGIAKQVHKTGGHGDTSVELTICQLGAYGSDGFPKFFTSRSAAKRYNEGLFLRKGVIVELDLVEEYGQ